MVKRKRNKHNLYKSQVDEIFRICDEITVLRDGEYIGTDLTSNMTRKIIQNDGW